MAVRWINRKSSRALSENKHVLKMTRFSYMYCFLTSSVLAKTHEVQPLSKELAEEYKLDTSFYKKATYVQDILIATSDKVSDYAHLEAAYLYDPNYVVDR